MSFELTAVTGTILAEIADERFKQADVAKTYALAIMAPESVDWPPINRAIQERWSVSGLIRVKNIAHRMLKNTVVASLAEIDCYVQLG